ncbi:uncharacterized protein DC041_0009769 [Schistosoma bovis]|uniref:Uncharacterized protein n=1 Tax=Schistosoma bovis TaxID=6184 RepID=A0A430QBB4_SCHBO|nr:uncharacterized protein DC041_0009769 [Schistosoma bovis]
MAGDFNAQLGKLSDRERHLGGSYSIVAQRTDNGDRLKDAASKPLRALLNDKRSQLKHRLVRSLCNGREQWWVAKAREVEKAAAIGNSRQLFRLVKETGIRNPIVSETLSEKDGHIIHSQSRRLDRWAEHFRDQFNWPSSTLRFSTISGQPEWQVNVGPPSLYEDEKISLNNMDDAATENETFHSMRIFDHIRLRNIAGITGWLGHVLRMPEHRLPRRAMLTGVEDGWKKIRGGQTKTWHRCLKSLTSSLSHVGRCRLLVWGPRDYRNQWLESLGDMAQNRSQWRRCIHSLHAGFLHL